MSSNGPTPDYEFLPEEEAARPRGSGRKRAFVAGGAVVLLAAAGVGAYGLVQFMSSGDSAASAVPADALGYLSLDLDPSGGQKVEAYQTMRKFPALKEQLGLGDEDDPRRWLVDAVNNSGECSLDFEDDVAPWLGDKLAFSAIEGAEEPEPFFVMEVKDADAAEDGVATLFECGGGDDDFGTATVGDFMVVAETAEIADDVAAGAEEASLADDETFTARMDDAGGDGVLTGYLAPAAVDLMLEQAEQMDPAAEPGITTEDPNEMPVPVPQVGPEIDLLRDYLEDFEGAAMQLRFADEGLELQMTASGISGLDAYDGGSTGMEDLPGTTAVAYGFATGPDVVSMMEDAIRGQMSDAEYEAEVRNFEQQSGLAFPEDVQTLLGDGLSLSLDSSIDFEALFQAFSTGQLQGVEIPVGLRIITDDTDAVVAVTDKLQALIPPYLPVTMAVEEGDDAVAVGVDPDYVAELAGDGDLGESEAFQDAVPDAEDSVGGVYVDFDAEDWLEEAVGQEDPEALANIEPLSSLGLSSTVDDEQMDLLVRLTTD